jgi:glycosyltransferase involved in cell wall biosynthesis
LDVIVVCNGCVDETAEIARAHGAGVRVIETDVGSKVHALNLGDRAAEGFPRVYADADVRVDVESIRQLVDALNAGVALAASPVVRHDLSDCSWAVRAFYSIDAQLPSRKETIGGSGIYALSAAGRGRFECFPDVTADDAFVRRQFAPRERTCVAAATSTVTPPANLSGLVAIKSRSHYGNYELAARFPRLSGNRGASNRPALLRLMCNPARWPALAVYCYVKIVAKTKAYWRFRMKRNVAWERDDSSRVAQASV